jgi:hypothetical protein
MKTEFERISQNLAQIEEVMLQPKTPANKGRLLELITTGEKIIREFKAQVMDGYYQHEQSSAPTFWR